MTTRDDRAVAAQFGRQDFAGGQCVVDGRLAAEFLLAVACCRWPPSPARNAAVRAAAAGVTDWNAFLRMASRQRVVGFVRDALSAAELDIPRDAADKLASQFQNIARQNVLFADEAARLYRLFDTAQIPILVLKGLPLAQLAYGSCNSKQTRDIDLLVPPECAEAALQMLEREGYVLFSPAEHLSTAQRRAVVQYTREVELRHRDTKMLVELQWRLTNNPLLLQGIDAYAATQSVVLCNEASVRTLAPDDLFAQLCVHGAGHAWSRLKWLADLNALLAAKGTDIVHLYRHAQSIGAGLCAGQALLLCHFLFDLELPPALMAELQRNKRVLKLKKIALWAMTRPHAKAEGVRAMSANAYAQFLLGQGWAFYAAQCRIASVGIFDVVAVPLPPSLQFLYPLLRVPLWLWRRVTPSRGR
jgi:hypothetical protein